MKSLYKIELSTVLLTGLLFGLIFSASLQYFIQPLRIIFIMIFFTGMFLTFKNDLKYNQYITFYIYLSFILLLGLISLNISTLPLNIAAKELYVNLSMVFGFFAFRYYDKFKELLIYFIVVNFAIMIFDIYNLEYLFNFDPVLNYYQIDRGKGLFSYSKEAGSFTIFAALLFRKNKNILILLFLTSVLSGSRSGIIFIFAILFMDTMLYGKIKLNFQKIMLFGLSVLIVIISLYIFYETSDSLFRRMNNSFDFSSSGTHSFRFFIWHEYINQITHSNFLHIIFGNPGYILSILGNGAENAYLTVFTNSGLILFLLYYIPLIFLALLSIINFKKFYPIALLLILLQFGRQGTGWADGILLWAYVYHIYNGGYMKMIVNRITRGKII